MLLRVNLSLAETPDTQMHNILTKFNFPSHKIRRIQSKTKVVYSKSDPTLKFITYWQGFSSFTHMTRKIQLNTDFLSSKILLTL